MEGSEPKKGKVFNKKNDLLTKLQKKVKKKIKRDEKLIGIRQCRKSSLPEAGRLRLKGLRTQYISRETLNEANEARKNEDINKIIDIGRVFQKKGAPSGERKRAANLNSAADNPKSQKITEKDLTMASVDFDRCSLSGISADATALSVGGTDATIILNDPTLEEEKKKKLNFDRKLVMFSLLYEETVGAELLPRLNEFDVLEEAFRALRNKPEKDESKKEDAIQFVKEFKFLRGNSDEEMPLEIFREDFPRRNYAPETGNRSSDVFMAFMEKPTEDELINLNGMGTCGSDPLLVPLFAKDQLKSTECQTQEFEKPITDLNTTFAPIQFYRRNMF